MEVKIYRIKGSGTLRGPQLISTVAAEVHPYLKEIPIDVVEWEIPAGHTSPD